MPMDTMLHRKGKWGCHPRPSRWTPEFSCLLLRLVDVLCRQQVPLLFSLLFLRHALRIKLSLGRQLPVAHHRVYRQSQAHI